MSKNYKEFIKEYGLGYNALLLKPMAALNPLRKKRECKESEREWIKKIKRKKLEISTYLMKCEFG